MTLAEDIARLANEYSTVSYGLTDHIAAGLERECVLVKRSDLPEVATGKPSGHYFVNEQFYHRAGRFREIALEHLAIAEHMESATRESEARLQARRDELADELSMGAYDYAVLGPMLRNAIDLIITEQDNAAAGRDGGKA